MTKRSETLEETAGANGHSLKRNNNAMRKVTISDIAREAGVSRSVLILPVCVEL